jgi:hypothetical protein
VETGIRPRKDQPTKMDFAHRVLIGAGIVIALILTILLLITTIRVWLLIFFGILIAVFLRGVSDWVSGWSRLPERLCLTLVILALAGLIGLSVWLLSPHVTEQVNSLSRGMLRAMGQVKDFLDKYLGAAQILGTAEKPGKMIGEFGGLFTRLGEFFSVTMAALTGAVVVFFAALYFAFNPSLYIRGIVKLIPVGYRESALEVIRTLGFTLKWWLIGRASMMVIVGILSGVGLWLLQIPLALTLGILAGLLTLLRPARLRHTRHTHGSVGRLFSRTVRGASLCGDSYPGGVRPVAADSRADHLSSPDAHACRIDRNGDPSGYSRSDHLNASHGHRIGSDQESLHRGSIGRQDGRRRLKSLPFPCPAGDVLQHSVLIEPPFPIAQAAEPTGVPKAEWM